MCFPDKLGGKRLPHRVASRLMSARFSRPSGHRRPQSDRSLVVPSSGRRRGHGVRAGRDASLAGASGDRQRPQEVTMPRADRQPTRHRTPPRSSMPPPLNEVRLGGRLAAEPVAVVLPSGDELVTLRLVVPRTAGTRALPVPGRHRGHGRLLGLVSGAAPHGVALAARRPDRGRGLPAPPVLAWTGRWPAEPVRRRGREGPPEPPRLTGWPA